VHRTSQLFAESLSIRLIHVKTYRLGPTWSIQHRSVPHSILWYARQGSFRVETKGESHRADAGTLVFLADRVPFSACTSADKLEIVSINFAAEMTYVGGKRWSDLLRIPVTFPYDMSGMAPLIEKLAGEPKGAFHALHQTAWLYELIGLMLDQLSSSAAQIPPLRDARVKLATEYILNHPDRKVGLRDLCELVDLSPTHLRRLFAEQTGQSPLAFIRRVKMDQARIWLLETPLRISEIAYRLGFSDQNYFARMYKQTTGLTPSEYRRQFQI